MTLKEFVKEMVKRQEWVTIRVIFWANTNPKTIWSVGEFHSKPDPTRYHPNFINHGKDVAAHVKKWFTKHCAEGCTVEFEQNQEDEENEQRRKAYEKMDEVEDGAGI